MIWHYTRQGQVHGPVSADDLRALIRSGQVTRGTLVWRSGLAEWIAAGNSELGAQVRDQPPSVPPPPGQATNGERAQGPAAAESPGVEPRADLAQTVRWTVYAYMAVSVVGAVVMLDLFQRLISIDRVLLSVALIEMQMRLAGDQSPLHWVEVLYISAFVIAGIFILMWTYRACSNLHAVGASGVTIGPGWAVAWYFIPIFWFWNPSLAMAQIARSSQDPRHPHTVTAPGPIGWWWFLWLASWGVQILSLVWVQEGIASMTPELLYLGLLLATASYAMQVPLSLTLLSIVKRVTRAQDSGCILRAGALDR